MGLFNDLMVRLGWDGSAFKKGMVQAEIDAQKHSSKLQHTLSKFTARQEHHLAKQVLGVFGFEALKEGFSSAAEHAAKINEESAKMGVSVEQFQAMEYASKQTGMSVEEMVKNMKDLPPYVREAMQEFQAMGMGMSPDQVADLARAHRNIEQTKAYGTGLLGNIAAGANWLGEAMGTGITKTEAYWQKFLGNDDYAAELYAETMNNPNDDEEVRRKQMRLEAKKAEEQKRKDAWLENFWAGWDEAGEGIARQDARAAAQAAAFDRAKNARGSLSFDALNPNNRIGGFYGGVDPMAVNMLQKQIDVLERIERALKDEVPGA